MRKTVIAGIIICCMADLAGAVDWVYKVEFVRDAAFSTRVNKIGADGWELVFARRATDDDEYGYEMIFKKSVLVVVKEEVGGEEVQQYVELAAPLGARRTHLIFH